jgi:hypothetical protein
MKSPCQTAKRFRNLPPREAVAIAERKQRLISIFGNVAEFAAERMEELAGKASLRDAGTTAGIATDKLLALLGESGGGVPVQINMWSGVAEALGAAPEVLDQLKAKYATPGELLQARYNEMVRCLDEKYGRTNESVPNGETLSDSPAAMDLQSGENPQK